MAFIVIVQKRIDNYGTRIKENQDQIKSLENENKALKAKSELVIQIKDDIEKNAKQAQRRNNKQADDQYKQYDECFEFLNQTKKKLDELLPQFNELQQISQEFVKILRSQNINPKDILVHPSI